MIVDNIKNARFYYGLGPGIEAALRFLQETDLSRLDPGRYDVLGSECYALVQDYQTKPREGSQWEAHRKYVDVQYVVSGTESMGYASLEALEPSSDYDEAKDVQFLEGQGEFVTAGVGTFIIFAPWDAHMPALAAGESVPVRKVVVKVLADNEELNESCL